MRHHSSVLCLALAVGGFTAGSTLTSSTTSSFVLTIGDSRVGLLFSGGAGGVTLGVSLAAGVAWGARVRSYRAFAAVVGLTLVAFSVAPSGGELAVYAAASGAGMLLGSLAATVPPLGVVHGQTALAAGAIAGILCAESLVRLRRESSPRRYADYLPSSAEPVDALPLVFVVAAALAVLVLMLQVDTGTAAPEDVRLRGRGMLVGIILPAAWLILHWRFVGSVTGLYGGTALPGWWWGGLALIPVTVAMAAWIPGPAAAVLLAGTAVAFVAPSELAWYTEQWWALLIPVALVAFGSVAGTRIRRPGFGIAGLVVVIATALVDSPPWDSVQLIAVLGVFPLAAAFLIASCLPSEPAITVTALAAPAAILVPLSAEYGWTAYTPLPGERIGSTGLVSTVVTGTAIVALGAGISWVRGRPDGDRNGSESGGSTET